MFSFAAATLSAEESVATTLHPLFASRIACLSDATLDIQSTQTLQWLMVGHPIEDSLVKALRLVSWVAFVPRFRGQRCRKASVSLRSLEASFFGEYLLRVALSG